MLFIDYNIHSVNSVMALSVLLVRLEFEINPSSMQSDAQNEINLFVITAWSDAECRCVNIMAGVWWIWLPISN